MSFENSKIRFWCDVFSDLKMMKKSSGLKKRKREIPDDFIATSSKFSPILPNVIIEDRRTLSGSARGTSVVDIYISNCISIHMLRPLPIISSMYSQKNCIINTKRATKKVTMKGPIKLLMSNMSSFFINTYMVLATNLHKTTTILQQWQRY